jgi:hypothetical protein
MSPFENMNAKLYVKVSGSGKISEIEEHRAALPILERRKPSAQANRARANTFLQKVRLPC